MFCRNFLNIAKNNIKSHIQKGIFNVGNIYSHYNSSFLL